MRTITITVEDDSANKLIATQRIPMTKLKAALTPSLILSQAVNELEQQINNEIKARGNRQFSTPPASSPVAP